MSLLMEALRKAEEAQQKRKQEMEQLESGSVDSNTMGENKTQHAENSQDTDNPEPEDHQTSSTAIAGNAPDTSDGVDFVLNDRAADSEAEEPGPEPDDNDSIEYGQDPTLLGQYREAEHPDISDSDEDDSVDIGNFLQTSDESDSQSDEELAEAGNQTDKTELGLDGMELEDPLDTDTNDYTELLRPDPETTNFDETADAVSESTQESGDQQQDLEEDKLERERQQIVERELKKRQSANAVFQAKALSRNRHRRTYVIAAVLGLLLIPLAGGGFWFFNSLRQATSSQIPVPQIANVQNRGFLGEAPTQESVPEIEAGQAEDSPLTALTQTTPANTIAEANASDTGSSEGPVNETETIDPTESVASSAPSSVTPPAASSAPPTSLTNNESTTNTGQAQTFPPGPFGVIPATPASSPQAVAGSNPGNQLPTLTVSRRQPQTQVNPALIQAYARYNAGSFAEARELYQSVLIEQSNNRDAMLGLAAVAQRTGDIVLARGMYVRLLELNPNDVVARAGLLETLPTTDSLALESELKSLVELNPGIAPLSYALGNLFASQNRWNEAQNAYYNALLNARNSINETNISPDYAFNLAVSLERLNQLRPALDYYRQALDMSRNITPGFSIQQANSRINYLEQVLE